MIRFNKKEMWELNNKLEQIVLSKKNKAAIQIEIEGIIKWIKIKEKEYENYRKITTKQRKPKLEMMPNEEWNENKNERDQKDKTFIKCKKCGDILKAHKINQIYRISCKCGIWLMDAGNLIEANCEKTSWQEYKKQLIEEDPKRISVK